MATLARSRLRSRVAELKSAAAVSQYKGRIKRLYDGPAGVALLTGSVLSLHEPLLGHLLRRRAFDVSTCRSILDVGSGAGQILRHLHDQVCPETRVVAFDLSDGMLRRARSRLRQARIDFVTGDLTQLPFPDESFDCITCGWVLEHLPDPAPGLQELRRVLSRDGRLLLLTTEDTWQGNVVARTWNCRTYNRRELQKSCERAGLVWHKELWFTPLHERLRLGGILVEARRTE